MDQSLDGVPAFGGTFHHIGVATNDIASTASYFQILGFFPETEVIKDTEIDVLLQFLTNENFRIELVCPLSEKSPVLPWLQSGSPMYHLAFMVEELDSASSILKNEGFRKVYGPQPAIAFENRNIIFMMNRQRQMIELISAS